VTEGPSWLQIPSALGRCKTRPVIDLLRFVYELAADLVRRRIELVAENALLRQQLIAAERKVGRTRQAQQSPVSGRAARMTKILVLA